MTQELILPPGMLMPSGTALPKPIEAREAPDSKMSDAAKALTIPDPVGFKLLCMVPDLEETFHGTSIVKADSVRKTDEFSTLVLFVLKAGPQAYADKQRFPDGAWCKEGDFVMVRAYAGTRFMVSGKEFRLLNDDQIEAVVQDPRFITRVM